MEHSVVKLNDQKINKDIMRGWVEFITNINRKSNEQIQQFFLEVLDFLEFIKAQEFFLKESFSDEENFFISSFSPNFIRLITNENFISLDFRDSANKILEIYLSWFYFHLQNPKFNEIWESVVNTFQEDRFINRTNYEDSCDIFLDYIYDKLNPDSQAWRLNLQKGMEIDYLLKDFEEKVIKERARVANWTKAVILDKDDKYLRIKVLGNGDIFNNLPISSKHILPVNTLSNDYDWRESVQKGDEVDFLDGKTWLRSTILHSDIRYMGETMSKYIKYGLRIYREDGKQTDKNGRKYFGWSENFDKETSIHDPRIRKPNEFSKKIENFSMIKTYPLDYNCFNDLETHIPFEFKEFKFYSIPRKNDYYKLDITFILRMNSFIEKGGIVKILRLLNERENLTFESFSILIDLIHHFRNYLHIKYCQTFLKDFCKYVLEYLIYLSNHELRNLNNDKIEAIITKIKEIILRSYIESDINAIFEVFTIDFGVSFLNSTSLDKKLFGIKIISNVLHESSKSSISSHFSEKHVDINILIEKLKKHNLVELIFGTSSHVQLINKSKELFKFLVNGNIIDSANLTKIYDLSKSSDLELRNSILGLFTFMSFNFESSFSILNHILDNSKENINQNDLEIVRNLYRNLYSYQQREMIRKVISNYTERIFMSKISNEMKNLLIEEVESFVRDPDYRDYTENFILSIFNEFENNFLIAIKLLRISLRSIIKTSDTQSSKILELIITKLKIVEKIKENLGLYYKKVLEKNSNDKSADFLKYHCEYCNEIFNILSFLVQNHNKIFIFEDDIDIFFSIFVEKPIDRKDTSHFFRFIKEADEKKSIHSQIYRDIFKKMSTTEGIDFSSFSLDLISTIWNIFITINMGLGKITTLKSEAFYQSDIEKKSDFLLKCNPSSLEGYRTIWNMIILSQEGESRNKILKNFVKLFVNNNLLFNERSELWGNLISDSMEIIKGLENDGHERNLKIRNLLGIISILIEESEKKGTAGVTSHSSILKKRLVSVHIINEIISKSFENLRNLKMFTIQVFANITIWDLKLLISSHLNTIPQVLKIKLKDNNDNGVNTYSKDEFNDSFNGKTLNELNIQSEITIILSRSLILDDIPMVNLSEDGELTEQAKKVLIEIFSMMSTNGRMSRSQCAEFATIATASQTKVSPEDTKVSHMFNKYDTKKLNYIEVEGFLNFYRDSVTEKGKIVTVFNNIKRFGYRNDLRKLGDPLADTNNQKELMPRYLLSLNQDYFEIIFKLQEDVFNGNEASKLLSIISTNPQIYKSIFDLESSSSEGISWENLLEVHNIHRLNYKLQILESFFEEFELGLENKNNLADSAPLELSNSVNLLWIEKFIIKGGSSHILKLLHEFHLKVNSHLEKKILILLFKISKNCLSILFKSKLLLDKDNTLNRRYSSSFDLNEFHEESKAEQLNIVEDNLIESLNKKYGDKLNLEINCFDLSKILFEIVLQITENSDIEENEDDYILISYSFNLLNLIFNSKDNSGEFVEFFIKSRFLSDKFSFVEGVISGSLICKNHKIKKCFTNNILILFNFIKKNDNYLVFTSLISGLQEIALNRELLKQSGDCSKFFNLLIFLLSQSNSIPQILKHLDFKEICLKFAEILLNSREDDDDSIIINEEILIGYLRIINITCSSDSSLRVHLGELKLISKLLDFFTFKTPYIEEHKDELINPDSQPLKQRISFFSKESRNEIFKLIIKLCDEKENLDFLFNSHFVKIVDQIVKINKTSYDPQNEKRDPITNFIGIRNLGSICYMNAMLQQFFHIPTFRYLVSKIPVEANPNQKLVDDVLFQLQRMYSFLEFSDRKSYNPTDFCYSFKDYDGKPTQVSIQQDAQEFLGRLFDKLEQLTKKTNFRYLLPSIFGGKTCSQLKCGGGCGTTKLNIEDFSNLSLEVKNMKNLQDSLNKYIAEEKIEDFFCENCKKNVTITKKNSLYELPNVLIIHLQRILYNYDKFQNEKINSRLEFGFDLNLSDYCTKPEIKENDKIEEVKSFENNNEMFYERDNSYYQYELVGIVEHYGVAESGHYYSYINVKREGNNDEMELDHKHSDYLKKWVEFNDATVKDFDTRDTQEKCFGGDFNKFSADDAANNGAITENASCLNAYMLVYERKKKTPIKLIVDKENINEKEQIVKINKANKITTLRSYDKFNVQDEEIKQTVNKVFYDEDKLEYFKLLPFYSIEKSISNRFYQEVRIDNVEFYNEQKIFNPEFNEFLLGVIEKLGYLDESDDKIFQKFEICFRFFVEIFTRGFFKDKINLISKSLSKLISKKKQFSNYIIDFILGNKQVLSDLLFSSDENANLSYANLIAITITSNSEMNHEKIKNDYKNKEKEITVEHKLSVILLLEILLEMIKKEVPKNWTKLSSYFELINGLCSCKFLKEYLEYKEIVYLIIDFFLYKESPYYNKSQDRIEFGTKMVNPKFSPLITSISTLINEFSIDYQLSERDRKCLYSKQFYQKSLKEGYDSSSLSSIICKLMRGNKDFTISIIYQIMEVFNEYMGLSDLKRIFDILTDLISVDDQFSLMRIEMILGLPQIVFKYTKGIFPYIAKFEYRYDKIYEFNSFLLTATNHDSLIDQMIRISSHADYITIIYYFFKMVLSNNNSLMYFDGFPNPKKEISSLKECFLDIIHDEISTNQAYTQNKSNEQFLNYLSVLPNYYDIRIEECKFDGEKINLKKKYEIVRLIKEYIFFLPFEDLISKNVYLIDLEYEAEIHSPKKKEEIKMEEEEFKIKEIHKVEFDDKYVDKSQKNDGSAEILKENTIQLNDLVQISKGKFSDLEYEIIKQSWKNEEDFYRKISQNVKSGKNYYRNLNHNHEKIYVKPSEVKNCVKRLILVNNSDKNYKIKINIKQNHSKSQISNNLIPASEFYIKSSKLSVSKVINLVKTNPDLDWTDVEISAEIEEFNSFVDLGSNFNIFEENGLIFHSSNDDDYKFSNYQEINNENGVTVAHGPYPPQHYGIDAAPALQSQDGFELECYFCTNKNFFTSSDTIFKCSQCHKMLLE